MGEILCKKKDCPNSEDEFHHIIPRFMGGKDINGRVTYVKNIIICYIILLQA